MTKNFRLVIICAMEKNSIVEFVDNKRILSGLVLEVYGNKLRLLTEENREMNLAPNRVLYQSPGVGINPHAAREQIVESLKTIVARRTRLARQVNVQLLWEVLHEEGEWIDFADMVGLVYPAEVDADHESAVLRAFFYDDLYFRFKNQQFFAHTREEVVRLIAWRKEAERRAHLVEEGARWVRARLNNASVEGCLLNADQQNEILALLKNYCLFGKDFSQWQVARDIVRLAEIDPAKLFEVLVKLKVFDEDENIDVIIFGVELNYSAAQSETAREIGKLGLSSLSTNSRKDFTELALITIDGQATLDYDDAISLEAYGDGYRLGLHIADVAHFIPRGSELDRKAQERCSSVYMPDMKISMLPTELSEGACSLKQDEVRPSLSAMVEMGPGFEVRRFEVVPGMVKVARQLNYHEANKEVATDGFLIMLHRIAENFRRKRLAEGAIYINLPELNLWVDENKQVFLNKINRESPMRMMVTELMIMTNWLTAEYLKQHNLPAIYRSQAAPRERLYEGMDGTLFQNWMQRRCLSRFVLGSEPERHCGLGVEAYVTTTSPIRKYSDLVAQRQLRSVHGLEKPYSRDEIDELIKTMELPMSHVARLQAGRQRYWLLKYLEPMVGQRTDAVVLVKRRNEYQVLLKDYMIECYAGAPVSATLKPGDCVSVTLQRVNARADQISVFVS